MLKADTPVRLRRPTDFEILSYFMSGEQDRGSNAAAALGKDPGYVNNRLPELTDQGLLERVGEAERSGIYRITPLGVAAYHLRDEYDRDDWEDLIQKREGDIIIKRPEIVDHHD